jgi:hypothetical protein
MHTVLGKSEFYALETGGVPFTSWLADFVEGRRVGDVDCHGDAGGCLGAK